MTTLGNENLRDGDTAKKRAQAMKSRLKEMGHEIPLTHAYEALATSCGFRNWPTMKAHLTSTVALKDRLEPRQGGETANRSVFFDEQGNPWTPTHGRSHGYDLVYAPPGKGKTSFSQALDLIRLDQNVDAWSPSIPEITIIDLEGTSHALMNRIREEVPKKSRHLVRHVRLMADRTQSINVFDTPLGMRRPPAAQRLVLANFLVSLLGLPRILEALPDETYPLVLDVVDRVYAVKSDGTPHSRPKMYEKGRLPELDRDVSAVLPVDGGALSWWQVADAFFHANKVEHAIMAQRYAVPLLSDAIPVLMDISKSMGESGRMKEMAVSEKLMRCISRHLQLFPLLSNETDLRISRRGSALGVDLWEFSKRRGDEGVRELGIVFLVARQFFAGSLFVQSADYASLPKPYAAYHAESRYFNRNQGGAQRELLVYDDIHRLEKNSPAVRQIITDVRERKFRDVTLRISTQGLWSVESELAELATRVFMLGFSRKHDMDLFARMGVSPKWIDIFDSRLRGPTSDGLVFSVLHPGGADAEPEFITMSVEAEAVWAASTAPDDVLLKNKLTEEIGSEGAIKTLAKRFPRGSAGAEIDRRMAARDIQGLSSDIIDRIRHQLTVTLALELSSLTEA